MESKDKDKTQQIERESKALKKVNKGDKDTICVMRGKERKKRDYKGIQGIPSSSEIILYFSSPGTPSDTDQGGDESKDIEVLPRYEKGDPDIASGNEKALFSSGTPVKQTKEEERD